MISGEKERGRELAGYNYPELILDWHIHMAREWPQDKGKKKEEEEICASFSEAWNLSAHE